MRALVLAVVLLVVPVLGGCLDGTTDDVLDNATSENEPPVLPRALPDKREGEFAAFKETNRTDDYGAHRHDYWNGQTRIDLVRRSVQLDMQDASSSSYVLELPPGQLVYEGTGQVEVLLENPRRSSCWWYDVDPVNQCDGAAEDPGLASGVRLGFLHAASDPDGWIDAGTAQWGVPVEVDVVDATWTDMPHSSGSLWRFMFSTDQSLDETLVFDVTVTILKSGEPATWPGHPVFYDEDTHYRQLYDGPVELSEGRLQSMASSMEPAKLVGAGTRTLLVWVNVTDVEGRPYAPTHWAIWYHNASSGNWKFTDPFQEESKAEHERYFFALEVDANGMDGPYATKSRWEFFLRGAYTTPTVSAPEPVGPLGLSCIAGCVDYTVRYDLTIVATDLALPADAYTKTYD